MAYMIGADTLAQLRALAAAVAGKPDFAVQIAALEAAETRAAAAFHPTPTEPQETSDGE